MKQYDFSLVPEQYRSIVRILASWEQALSDGYTYYCHNAATSETIDECDGDHVLAVLTEIAKQILATQE